MPHDNLENVEPTSDSGPKTEVLTPPSMVAWDDPEIVSPGVLDSAPETALQMLGAMAETNPQAMAQAVAANPDMVRAILRALGMTDEGVDEILGKK
jgi:hypothetical protein